MTDVGIFRDDEVYTLSVVGKKLGLRDDQFTLQKLRECGISCARIGKKYLFSGKEINRWVTANQDTKSSTGDASTL